MKVKKILFDWHQIGSTSESCGADEQFSTYEVGKNGVVNILENEPHNGLQKWNYVVSMDNGSVYRVFNTSFVEYFSL